MTAGVWLGAVETVGFGSTVIVTLADWVVSFTEVAVTLTDKLEVTVAGGLYVAPVVEVFDKVPHEFAEQVGVPHVTPELVESFSTVAVSVAVSDWSTVVLFELKATDTCDGGGVELELLLPQP